MRRAPGLDDGRRVAAVVRLAGLRAVVELPERLGVGRDCCGRRGGREFHRLVRVADDGTETDIVTVAADDLTRGTSLRADGFRLHHRVAYRDLGD